MQQLQAAYFLEGINKLFNKETNKEELNKIKNLLSYFDLKTETDISTSESPDSVVATINNILVRGLPTIPSTFIEDIFSTVFHKTKKVQNKNNFSYNFINDEYKNYIYRALHIIEPRLNLKELKKRISFSKSDNDKNEKEDFLFKVLPEFIGEYFVQLITCDRTFKSIISNSEEIKEEVTLEKYPYWNDKIDFSLETPFVKADKLGFMIDIDNSQYVDNTDYLQETQKNKTLTKIKWEEILRLNKVDLVNAQEKIEKLQNFSYNKHFDNLRRNFKNPIYNTNSGLDALQLALSPLAIARVQKTILQFILSQHLDLNAKQWDIAIIERDVPAAFLAIEDLKKQFSKLFLLEGKKRKLPKINLTIYYTKEFKNTELNLLYQGEKKLIGQFLSNTTYDLLIDLSVLEYSNFATAEIKYRAKHIAVIRSVSYINSSRKFITTNLSQYQNIVNKNIEKTENEEDLEIELQDSLNFFLKNIFRGNNLTTKQLDFINSALQLENVLLNGLFDGEQTVFYQLAAILQPAISIIVNPNMTIMKEQFDKIREMGIDGAIYINSSQTKVYDKQKAFNKFTNKEALFSYISADRFEIEVFRKKLSEMINSKSLFAYLIIDGIHSISEWSHSYINSYRTLYQNVAKCIKQKNETSLPVLGFTATASHDVVCDIKTRIKFEDKNIIYQKTDLSNLTFKFAKTEDTEIKESEYSDSVEDRILVKENYLTQNLENISNTLIYCHKPKKILTKLQYNNRYSNIDIYEGTIDNQINKIGEFASRKSYKNYKDFKSNKLDLLISTDCLATAAYKKDIREGVFFNTPSSLENFAEQINIIGNDGQPANCIFLIDKYEDGLTAFNFKQKYKNKEKDLSIVNELLTEINYPTVQLSEILLEKVEKEFEVIIVLESQPTSKPSQLYVYSESQDILYGFIDYETNSIKIKASEFTKDIAERILMFLKQKIESIINKDDNLFEILNKKNKRPNKKGIEKLIAELDIGGKSSLIIDFHNESFDKIQYYIENTLRTILKRETIINIYNNTYDFDSFLKELSLQTTFDLEYVYGEYKNKLIELYSKTRNFYETYKSLQRLLTIGVIDCISVDYNKHNFLIHFTKKPDNVYYVNILERLNLFLTNDKVLDLFEKIPDSGNTAIKRSANFYINFIHNNIVVKHKNSLENVNNFISENKLNNNEIINFVTNFYSAKYLYELDQNLKLNFETVKKMINKIDATNDNLLHLLNSTEILMEKNPDNYTLLILNGYASLILANENDEILIENLQKLTDGLSLLRLDEKLLNDKYLKDVEWVMEKLFDNNIELKEKIESIFSLKLHNSWLYYFNRKFTNK